MVSSMPSDRKPVASVYQRGVKPLVESGHDPEIIFSKLKVGQLITKSWQVMLFIDGTILKTVSVGMTGPVLATEG